ncbi:hypothetical protein B9057_05985 [Aestuarium zhoushanense]|nr:hypothetical protein B9057_05985 [Aestuarium zhoushanense]
MRAQAKQARREDEEESAFVSMTDMTVGFLFIMMILLAFFASQSRETETVPRTIYEDILDDRDQWRNLADARGYLIARYEATMKKMQETIDEQTVKIEELLAKIRELEQIDPLESYLADVTTARREILSRLRIAILADFPDLKVELSEESDALRFQGEGLFASGQSRLRRDKAAIVSRLAERLDEILPCFSLGEASQFDESCNPSFALVEAVQIEGHTDNLGADQFNRRLSADRANNTFFAMTSAADGVMQHLNLKLQPVLSVAAYGPDRPVAPNETVEGRATNRRIDLRFIMVTPQDTDGIKIIRDALEASGTRP